MIKLLHGDSYKLIKEIPDKSVDLIYTDIPYDLEGNGVGAFGSKKRDYHKEYYDICEKRKDINAKQPSRISISKANNNNIADISFGIDYAILDEFVRIQPLIYIYGVVKNNFSHLWNIT